MRLTHADRTYELRNVRRDDHRSLATSLIMPDHTSDRGVLLVLAPGDHPDQASAVVPDVALAESATRQIGLIGTQSFTKLARVAAEHIRRLSEVV
jgi:hypothetical protein